MAINGTMGYNKSANIHHLAFMINIVRPKCVIGDQYQATKWPRSRLDQDCISKLPNLSRKLFIDHLRPNSLHGNNFQVILGHPLQILVSFQVMQMTNRLPTMMTPDLNQAVNMVAPPGAMQHSARQQQQVATISRSILRSL